MEGKKFDGKERKYGWRYREREEMRVEGKRGDKGGGKEIERREGRRERVREEIKAEARRKKGEKRDSDKGYVYR